MSAPIFSAQVRSRSRANARATAAAQPSTAVLAAEPVTLETRTTVATPNDAVLIGILEAPLRYGETAREGFLRKEAEFRAAFAGLAVGAQRALHARLSNPRSEDALATKFAGLTADRRTRLITFLSDARRREALAAAKR
jgi:hypothetical protein